MTVEDMLVDLHVNVSLHVSVLSIGGRGEGQGGGWHDRFIFTEPLMQYVFYSISYRYHCGGLYWQNLWLLAI